MDDENRSYSTQWLNSIDEISKEQWLKCFPEGNVLTSYEFQLAVEHSNLTHVAFHYLLLFDNERLVAIFPCFSYTYSLVELANLRVRKAVDCIRKAFPNVGYYSIFVAGSPVATCKHMIGINQSIQDNITSDIIGFACQKIQTYAKKLRISLIAIKEIESQYVNEISTSLPDEFAICESPATTYVYTAPINGKPYIENMYSKYRVAYKKRLKNFEEAGLRWEKVYDFSIYSQEMCALYLNVLSRSKVKFEQLTPDFFKQVSVKLQQQSYALLCFKAEKLVAFELFLVDDELHPIYLGMDYSLRDQASLYFNCIYRIIEEAQENNRPFIELGQTSYDVKASLGAVFDRLYIAVMHTNPIINRLLKYYKGVFFPPTQAPKARHIFKNLTDYHACLTENNIAFELEE